jgi:tetratricopeptide (TPR) repeat protein
MSETNSLKSLDQTTGSTPSARGDVAPTLDASEPALGERLGVGGMGEVYRFRDDALDRDLAIKILKAELHGDAAAEARFLREARLTGSLQHPGIVPVHQLGRLADGRPCYTMKLVRGRTLADMIRDEPEGPERLPRLLAVVEKLCQAVGFAHSKGVLHRDLKPSNVMVGEFGEVQVMDWGLAKELSVTEPAPPPDEATENVETVGRVEEAAGLSRAGAALGTPAYMPPEQAAGDWDIVDERADVFALGAILCEVLTGRPPYHGASRDDLLRRARRGDLTEALSCLEQCGADGVLVQLCRDCLAAERLERPRHAGVVADRLASYQAEVRERLRQAELERARIEVQALEQRKRRRLRMALALAALLLLSGGAAVWWQGQRRQAEADRAVDGALDEARLLAAQARADPLTPAGYDKAVAAAWHAGEMAHAGGASQAVQRQTEALLAVVQAEAETAEKDRRLLVRLLEVRGPREGPKYTRADEELTIEEQFASAFRDWGLDVDGTPLAEATARLKENPPAVVMEVIAALDEWASQRRVDGKPLAACRCLVDLATALDDDSGSLRRDLHALLARDRLPVERALELLSAALRPVPMPMAVPWGEDHVQLRQLAERTGPAEPVLGLLTLTRALRVAGEEVLAERLLRAAIDARPREVVLYHTLGDLLTEQEPPRWAEAAEFYRAARVQRTDLGVTLANVLIRGGKDRDGLRLFEQLVQDKPGNPYLHFQQGVALRVKHDVDGAIACFQKALDLDPKYAPAHNSLGNALNDKGDREGAIACYQKALDLNPKYVPAHSNLGACLADQGDRDGAIACYKKALELDPKYALAHNNLGNALKNKGDLDEAIACYQKALELDPKFALAHNNLGFALATKGEVDSAVACYHKALELDPKHALAHNNLGIALYAKGERDGAITCYKKALELDPKFALAHYNLGIALRSKGDLVGAIVCYQKALALDPKDAQFHNNLGLALATKGEVDNAIACYHKALELDPNFALAHSNLGIALYHKHDLDGAIACYKKALALDSKHAQTWGALGLTLLSQGRYAEGRDATRRALALFPSSHPQQRLATQQLRRCEQYLVLDGKLPAILQGQTSPANPGEAVTLAQMCQQHKKRHVAAARLYADAFAAEPKIAADIRAQHRYNAACSAALAAAGHGEDARSLPNKVTAMFRRWAIRWLRDDLSVYAKDAEKNNPATNKAIQQLLAHWRSDPELASVRDEAALERLPDGERDAWRALWRDVDELAARLAKKTDY